MMGTRRSCWAAWVVVLLLSGAAPLAASVITKIEPNDSIAGAQNIDGAFSLDYSPDIGDWNGADTSTTIPHVSISGVGNGSYDYYLFTVPAGGGLGIFDVDYVTPDLDSWLDLWPYTGGARLAWNDDDLLTRGAGGSSGSSDAFIQYSFTAGGPYVIMVGKSPGAVVDPGQGYVLHVSIENSVPEPASLVLLGGGLLGLGGAARRRRRSG